MYEQPETEDEEERSLMGQRPLDGSRPPSRLPYIRSQPSFPTAQSTSSQNTPKELQRAPLDYSSIERDGGRCWNSSSNSAIFSRYKYYSRLAPARLTMPAHVASVFVIRGPVKTAVTQSSLVTILSLCNTMVGTSLLSIPWALNRAGFATGVILLVMMGVIMCYTSLLILNSAKDFNQRGEIVEFTDICRHYLGRWAEYLALVSALLTFLGGMIVYWILLSNFLYNIVLFIYYHALGNSTHVTGSNDPTCPHGPLNSSLVDIQLLAQNMTDNTKFEKYWDEQKTVPFVLIILLLPLSNIKSPTFFTKFNSFGTVSVTYLVCFAMKNAISWGIHVDFHNKDSSIFVPEFKSTFPSLTGVAAFGYFIQNSLLSITRTQSRPDKNKRDLFLAYILVLCIYLYMGVMVYMSFSLNKDCIEDNFLNNLKETNIMAFVARIGLFFQLTCVFPLLAFIFRVQLMKTVFGSVWPSLVHVLVLNVVLVAICVLFAVFLPHIGHIIGLFGAFSGFTYAILLPCLVYLKILKQTGKLNAMTIAFHSFLIVIGILNLAGQFLQITQ